MPLHNTSIVEERRAHYARFQQQQSYSNVIPRYWASIRQGLDHRTHCWIITAKIPPLFIHVMQRTQPASRARTLRSHWWWTPASLIPARKIIRPKVSLQVTGRLQAFQTPSTPAATSAYLYWTTLWIEDDCNNKILLLHEQQFSPPPPQQRFKFINASTITKYMYVCMHVCAYRLRPLHMLYTTVFCSFKVFTLKKSVEINM
jgi:hypothetical protein